jgi:indole-3-glycerol phosphate synthase
MILSDIIKAKRGCIEQSKKIVSLEYIKHQLSKKNIPRRSFKHAISQSHDINIIAEIKKASPTRGVIRGKFDPKSIAKEYQINGAAAISVLTEENFFKGKLSYIKEVKKVTNLPVLRKDFIIDEYQVYESAFAQADAILLITDILSREEIVKLSGLAKLLNMAVLCEAHSKEELEKAISARQDIIGINNRDINTFKLSKSTTENLIGLVPGGKIIVSESGIRTRSDILFLKSIGVSAVLIGEVFMDAEDIGGKVREFTGK